jgi:hypothetical protein
MGLVSKARKNGRAWAEKHAESRWSLWHTLRVASQAASEQANGNRAYRLAFLSGAMEHRRVEVEDIPS